MTNPCTHDWLKDVKAADLTCKYCGLVVHQGEAVVVGDKMLISVELIEVIKDDKNPLPVIVERIEVGPDGIKTIWMRKA